MFLVKADALFGYLDADKFVDVAERAGAVTRICRDLVLAAKWTDRFIPLVRVEDLAKIVGKTALQVFCELVSDYAIPLVPIHGIRSRVWCVPICHDLERYLQRHGHEALLQSPYYLVDVTDYPRIKDILAMTVVAKEVFERAKIVEFFETRVETVLGSFLPERLIWLMARVPVNVFYVRTLEDDETTRFVHMRGRVFVPLELLILHAITKVKVTSLEKVSVKTILKKGFAWLSKRVKVYDAKLNLDCDKDAIALLKRVSQSVSKRNNGFVQKFYTEADLEFRKACERAIFDRENKVHYLLAILRARKFNLKCYHPKLLNFLDDREWAESKPNLGQLEERLRQEHIALQEAIVKTFSESIGRDPTFWLTCDLGGFRISVPVDMKLESLRKFNADEKVWLYRLAVEFGGLAGYSGLLNSDWKLRLFHPFSVDDVGYRFLAGLREPLHSFNA